MATGGGATSITCSVTPMNVPGMRKKLYTNTERLLSDCMHQLLNEKTIAAGEEENKLAMVRGDFHQGMPAITVVVDGGWSNWSHKHLYNAKSGVAVIFGQCTKKLLFLGVQHKYCAVCSVAENQSMSTPHHRCYHNRSGSSAAMESDIIVEGFRLSEQTHGLRYMRIIGDGDSSVADNLQQCVTYGPFIKKIECANHAYKCYRSKLESLAKDHPEFRGKGV